MNWQQDPFGNFNARVVFPEPRKELTIAVELVAPMTVINPFDFFLDDVAQKIPFTYPDELSKELGPYLEVTEAGPRLLDWLKDVSRTDHQRRFPRRPQSAPAKGHQLFGAYGAWGTKL
ncbi:hypothetical protein HAALTHF_25270n [Vreelandella aquamarina]|nr:hypothetical protein HAALTHF_25270n [Halomonas axialensis]